MSDISIISAILVVVVAFLAGLEGILDQFQFHQPIVACTLIGLALVTSKQGLCLVDLFNDRPWLGKHRCCCSS